MRPQVLLIHGFNVSDKGVGSVGELRGFFAAKNYPYHILKYGHSFLLDTRFRNDNVARRVAEYIKNADRPVVVVGHSNGCTITYLAMTLYGAKPGHCVFINPALRSDIKLPNVCSYDVWHSPSDKPVKWARWLPKAKFRPWGDMGAVGALSVEGLDLINFNKEVAYEVISDRHSDVFSTEKLSFYGPLIVDTVERRLSNEKIHVTTGINHGNDRLLKP